MISSKLESTSPLLIWLRVFFAIAMIGIACIPTNDENPPLKEKFDLSTDVVIAEARDKGDYEGILNRLRRAAIAGHPAARELLGVLLLGGPSAFRFSGTRGEQTCEALAWLDLAAEQGSQIGRNYRELLSPIELSYARKTCFPLED